jgi:hypothetical protein
MDIKGKLLELKYWYIIRPYWNHIHWKLVKAIPRRVMYWSVVHAACKDEQGNPGYVTAMTMLKRLEKKR